MANVEVRTVEPERDPLVFRVTVRDKTESSHDVTVKRRDLERLARDDESPDAFVERCFRFLLEREPQGSIMKRFDLTVVSTYFPEFEDTIAR